MKKWVGYGAVRWDGFGDWASGAGAWDDGTRVGETEDEAGEGDEKTHGDSRWSWV